MPEQPSGDEDQSGNHELSRRDALKTLGAAGSLGTAVSLPQEAAAAFNSEDAEFSTVNRSAYGKEVFGPYYGDQEEMINEGYGNESELNGPWIASGVHQQQVTYEVEEVEDGTLYTFYVDSRMTTQVTENDPKGTYKPRDGVRYDFGPNQGELVSLAPEEDLTVPLPTINAQTFALRIRDENARVVDYEELTDGSTKGEYVSDDSPLDDKAVAYTRTHANGNWAFGPWTHSASPDERLNVYELWQNTSPSAVVAEHLDFIESEEKVAQLFESTPDRVQLPDARALKWAGKAGGRAVLLARIVATYGQWASNCNAKREFDSPEEVLKQIALDKSSMIEGVLPYAGSATETILTELTGQPTITEIVNDTIEAQEVPDGQDYWFEKDHGVVKSTGECALPAAGHTAKVTVKVPAGADDAIDIVSKFHLTQGFGVTWKTESQRVYVTGTAPTEGCTTDCPQLGSDYEADPIPELAILDEPLAGQPVGLSAYPSQSWDGDIDHSETKWWIRQTNQDDGVRDGDAPPTGTGKEIEWTPGEPEAYTVRLEVTDSGGTTATDTFEIDVAEPEPPLAMLRADRTSVAGDSATISFDASRSYGFHAQIDSFDWAFGDGTSVEDGGSTIDHTYDSEGTYTTIVTVTDTWGNSTEATIDVTISEEAPPNAALSPDERTVQVDEATISFDASASTAPEGTVETYRFNFGDGTVVEGTDPTVTHTYEYVQEYEPAVTVTDSNGNKDVASSTIDVTKDTKPDVDVDFTHSADSYIAGEPISFEAAVTSGDTYTVDNYEWLVGADGQCGTDAPGDGYGEQYTHTFDDPGLYWVSLRVYVSSEDDLAKRCWQYPFRILPSNPDITTPDDATVNEIVTVETPAAGYDRYRWIVTDPEGSVVRSGDLGESFELPLNKRGNYEVDLRIENLVEEDNVSYPTTVYYEGTTTLSVAADPNEGPTAVVDAPSLVEIGEGADLDARNSADADGSIASYDWTVETADGQDTYTGDLVEDVAWTAAGDYDVSVTVTDDDGATASATRTVTVDENDGPSPELTGPTTVDVGAEQTYDATLSSDPDGSVAAYDWTIEKDADAETPTGGTATTTWNTPGEYTVSVELTDDDGATASTDLTVTAVQSDEQPVVQSLDYGPATPTTADTVTITAEASDPDGGEIVEYAWEFGDGTTATTDAGTATHQYESGDYTVSLTVTDDEGQTASATLSLSVQAAKAPEIDGIDVSPSAPDPGDTVTLTADASDPDDSAIVEYGWDFGDGESATTETASVDHSYESGGDYQVSLTVTDDEAQTTTGSATVSVVEPNESPTAAASAAIDGASIRLDASDSTDPDGEIAEYRWALAGGYDYGREVTVDEDFVPEDRQITLRVTDGDGATDTTTVTAPELGESPVAAFDLPRSAEQYDTVTLDASAAYDPDGEIVEYRWNPGVRRERTGETAEVRFRRVGQREITLEVTDDDGNTDTVTETIWIRDWSSYPIGL